MSTLFETQGGADASAGGRVVVCAGLDPAGTRWVIPAAVRRAAEADLPVLAYVHVEQPRGRSWGETISDFAGMPSLDPSAAAIDAVNALAGDWAGRVRCLPVEDRVRIADLVESVLAEGGCEAVFVGFESSDALPVGCRLCAEAEAECEAILMPFNPR